MFIRTYLLILILNLGFIFQGCAGLEYLDGSSKEEIARFKMSKEEMWNEMKRQKRGNINLRRQISILRKESQRIRDENKNKMESITVQIKLLNEQISKLEEEQQRIRDENQALAKKQNRLQHYETLLSRLHELEKEIRELKLKMPIGHGSLSSSKPQPLKNVTHSCENTLELKQSIKKLQSHFGLIVEEFAVIIDVSEQSLYLVKGKEIIKTYPISTSKYGVGSKEESKKTPLGTHYIFKKIGEGTKIGTVFKSGINTGNIARIYTDSTDIQQDLITTRIIRLKGLEPGINKGKGIDSYDRRIYIHGPQEEGLIGTPASNGCIRMKNDDVIELFDLVSKGTLVEIQK